MNEMRNIVVSVMLALSLLLTGCRGEPANNPETQSNTESPKPAMSELEVMQVETLQGWSFQYNEGTNDYSLFFGLLDKEGYAIAANVDVDIRIVGENGEIVYTATKSVKPDDFGTFTSQARGEQYLAEIRIPENDISAGKTRSGTVYFSVYKGDVIRFDEVNCAAVFCLPVLDVRLEAKGLPVEIPVKGYDGRIESKIRIDDVDYVFNKDMSPVLNVTVKGTKTYGNSDSPYDMVSYKLCDNEGYVITTGDLFLDSLSEGDKFKDNSIVIYDIEPGKTYTITFSESKI